MSQHYASIALLLLGGVLIGVVVALSLTLVWCLYYAGEIVLTPLVVKVCAGGNFKDVALALVGAVSAIAGAYVLKGK